MRGRQRALPQILFGHMESPHKPHENSHHAQDSWADEQMSRDDCCPVARQKESMKLLYFEMVCLRFLDSHLDFVSNKIIPRSYSVFYCF